MSQRKKNSSKINLTISVIFHGALVVAITFLAAREGMLGKKLKEITVTMAPKGPKKEPEQPKPKPEQPKTETPKPVETAKVNTAPPPVQASAPPPAPAENTPIAAPAAVSVPAFDFTDGAKETVSVSDPNVVYKGLVELALRSHWNRPEDMDDSKFVAEVELSIDSQGKVIGSKFIKSSGNARWDNTVKVAVAATKVISRAPPKKFPSTCIARFDVATEETENLLQLSSR